MGLINIVLASFLVLYLIPLRLVASEIDRINREFHGPGGFTFTVDNKILFDPQKWDITKINGFQVYQANEEGKKFSVFVQTDNTGITDISHEYPRFSYHGDGAWSAHIKKGKIISFTKVRPDANFTVTPGLCRKILYNTIAKDWDELIWMLLECNSVSEAVTAFERSLSESQELISEDKHNRETLKKAGIGSYPNKSIIQLKKATGLAVRGAFLAAETCKTLELAQKNNQDSQRSILQQPIKEH
jgi:hypothetical protein